MIVAPFVSIHMRSISETHKGRRQASADVCRFSDISAKKGQIHEHESYIVGGLMVGTWQHGYPKKQGYYQCLIDGELEMKLKYYVCQVSMKPHWIDEHGDYVETMGVVQWRGDVIK